MIVIGPRRPGNRGAVFRWGKRLDNGLWIRRPKFWLSRPRLRFLNHGDGSFYVCGMVFELRWGNRA